jgi:hypothetical protein
MYRRGAGIVYAAARATVVIRELEARKKRPMGLARPIGLYLVNAVVCFGFSA